MTNKSYYYYGFDCSNFYNVLVAELESNIQNGYISIGSVQYKINWNNTIDERYHQERSVGFAYDDKGTNCIFFIKYHSNPRENPFIAVAYSTIRFPKYVYFPLNDPIVRRFPALCFRMWMDTAIHSESSDICNTTFHDMIDMYIKRKNMFNKQQSLPVPIFGLY
jgi:hypothetical protein